MWLSRPNRTPARSACAAEVGGVTFSGQEVGVYLEGERRGMPLFAPGGYHWRPGPGQDVLVLKTGAQGELPCVIGAESSPPDSLQPGEAMLSTGSAAIHLTNSGDIALHGNISVNGERLEDLVSRLVTSAMPR